MDAISKANVGNIKKSTPKKDNKKKKWFFLPLQLLLSVARDFF
jgi:hypothetical protein